MSIEAINEQLLRAIGVGVALLDLRELRFRFFNDTFREWFGDVEIGQTLTDLFPEFDVAAMRDAFKDSVRFTTEASFRLRRRTMTIAVTIDSAEEGGEPIAVLVCQNISRIKELEAMIDSYSMMVERNTREIKREKEQVEKLLLNMMPRSVYEEYKSFGVVTPRLYEDVAVLCLDFAGFSEFVVENDAGVVVSELNDIYTAFDRIGDQFGCERIKTVGDTYITVAGMPDPADSASSSIANAAVRFVRYLEQRNRSHPIQWRCRVGVSQGAVIGSVVGVQKYIYDVFGPAVIEASQLRQLAQPMHIVGTRAFIQALPDPCSSEPVGTLDLGGKEPEEVFALTGRLDAAEGA
ncbi:adenylate/guanylate cyclase domain-containing protein [Novosphingobium pentaromativorans]|uniref:Putative adenylate/guanylate cyclase catalytic domain protein n=1 Tax=Novosphingobium pentaromativorans US6-1 TaxID=1088721 RepID=G6EH47_9SPHN|nr:adenylate/guanylate cyclase domain-containing protein [Novosphingobium pentaromativorans]AIT81975.1 adenylate cyclase [Novosphingobium pentaromativorans US6-1]EHJ59336.1 putative adenylate/guanylate cyclase catalytic domain protein [Novosphingobium pentaromativorans US6-1]